MKRNNVKETFKIIEKYFSCLALPHFIKSITKLEWLEQSFIFFKKKDHA